MKLEHSRTDFSTRARDEAVSRRKFFKMGAVGAALLASLQFGSFATALLTPSTARAQETEIEGRKVHVTNLDKTIADMDRDTARYRENEILPTERRSVYSNAVSIPNEVRFLVMMDPENKSGMNIGRKLLVTFPKTKEKDPSAQGAGMRGMNLDDFANYVKRISNKDMVRVKFLLETGTFQYEGNPTKYYTAYIFPLDAQGNIISQRGNGQYIVLEASHYNDVMTGLISLVVEPTVKGPVAQK
jgi:hypothetical protein